MNKSPFKATFGTTPPLLVGRENILTELEWGLDEGPGAAERVTLFVGGRGVGKTVMLNEGEALARERGWQVLSTSANHGFLDDLAEQAIRALARYDGPSYQPELSAVDLKVFRLEWQKQHGTEHDLGGKSSLRYLLEDLLDVQAELDEKSGQEPTGVLITVDELHYTNREEIVDFGIIVQHLQRQDRNIAVYLAGIPSAVNTLISDHDGTSQVTFLRRAHQVTLGPIPDDEVRRGLDNPVEEIGMEWDSDALDLAVEATGGYPYMMQLIGTWCVRKAPAQTITLATAEEAVEAAKQRLNTLVLSRAIDDLSTTDRSFLKAMAQSPDPIRIEDVAATMGISSQMAYNYRRRLIDAEIITPTGPGTVGFALPFLREYLVS